MKPRVAPEVALDAGQARLFDSACSQLQAGRSQAALELAHRLLAQAPQAADAWHLLGMCQAELGDQAEAERAFEAALAHAPDNPAILMNYAAWRNRLGHGAAAAALLERAAAAAPTLAQPRLQLGLLALDAQDHARAETLFRQALQLDPRALPAWHGLGNALREQDRLAAAEQAFARALALAPDYAPAWVNLGGVQRLQGRAEDALRSYARARAAGQGGAELEGAINGALVDSGRIDEALAGARRLVADHPGHARGHTTLARLLWEYGSPEEDPLLAFEQAAQARPDDRALQMELIRTLLEARQGERALVHAQRLHQRDRSDPLAQWLLADSHLQLGQNRPADLLYQQAERRLGGSSSFLNAYTRHAMHLRRWRQAEQLAGRALRIDRLNQEGWANLALAWRMLEDPREDWLCAYERLIGVVDVDTPPGHADLPAFLQALGTCLETLHLARREPVNQSVRRGSQTQGRLFGRPEPEIAAAQAVLVRAVERWLATLPDDPRHPFLARRPRSGRIAVTGSWSVKLWSSGHHANHMHPQGWISSAFYVCLPPSVLAQGETGTAGCIQFGQPLERLGLELPARRIVHPQPGKLVLFPSYLWHGTVPFVDDVPRLTVAFDMRPDD
ncbi:MAG: tetratricopeptide repeat protein [Pseudoxanthomonas sp.]